MASPAPLLRPPIPGSRNTSTSRTPKLGLAIPPSPHARPLNLPAAINSHAVPPLQIPRQAPPKLSLATPMGSHGVPHEGKSTGRTKLPPLQVTGLSAGGGSSDDSAHSRSESIGASNPNISTSTASSMSSTLNFVDFINNNGSQDPNSAYSTSSASGIGESTGLGGGENSIAVDLEKLRLEKGRPLDVEDLDDAGWKAAAKESRIQELGSLGEGAGGAVNRCILKGGKTVFALKVSLAYHAKSAGSSHANKPIDHHYRSESRRQETDCPRDILQQELRLITHLPLLRCFRGRHAWNNRHQYGVLRGRLP